MTDLTLVIANRNYSSWSLRPWLALKHTGLAFHEIVIPLKQPTTRDDILCWSPSGKLPALRHGGLVVWDSLAICEYLAELVPAAKLWPADPAIRAVARSLSAEMHSGFTAVRSNMPMNICASLPGWGRGPGVDADIARIEAIWSETRNTYGAGGAFLFGEFSIADAMFAPVVTRFKTYGVTLNPVAQAYAEAVLNWPALTAWSELAAAETWSIDYPVIPPA